MDQHALEELLLSTETDTHADMVARNTASDSSTAFALINKNNTDITEKTSVAAHHPEQYWDGERETLGSWLAELGTTLATVSPELYEFAVEFFLSDRNKTVIFFPGQAAQLDGAIIRPEYSWRDPAPTDAASYTVPDAVIAAAYQLLHQERCLRDTRLDPAAPPIIPVGAPYPIHDGKYTCSTAQLHRWQVRLRNVILQYISDLPVRHIYAEQFPRDGRALLDHLRALAETPLTTSQVNSVNAEINALTAAGIKSDDVASFREYGVIYHRLLARIPANNPSRDSPSMQAMRLIQATIKSRHDVGTTLMHHFASHSVDQNDPTQVRDSITAFLEDQAAVKRLCQPLHAQPHTAPLPTLPDLNALKTLLNQSLVNVVNKHNDPRKHERNKRRDAKPPPQGPWTAGKHKPCYHCGGDHWNRDCPDPRKGTRPHQANRSKSRKDADSSNVDLVNAAFAAWENVGASTDAVHTSLVNATADPANLPRPTTPDILEGLPPTPSTALTNEDTLSDVSTTDSFTADDMRAWLHQLEVEDPDHGASPSSSFDPSACLFCDAHDDDAPSTETHNPHSVRYDAACTLLTLSYDHCPPCASCPFTRQPAEQNL